MKLFKNRIVLGLLSIGAAAAICFVLAPMFNQAVNEQTTVVRVAAPIAPGKEIKSEMLEIVTVGAYNLPESILKNKEDILGNYATVAMLAGDYIMPAKISERRENAYLYELSSGKQAISVAISSFAAGLSGKLQAGDIVSVLSLDGKGDDSDRSAELSLLTYVKILALTMDNGTDNDVAQKAAYNPDGSDKETLPATVTLQVSPRQAAVLASMSKNHLVLVCRGEDAAAQVFLEEQEAYEAAYLAEEVPEIGGGAVLPQVEEIGVEPMEDTNE